MAHEELTRALRALRGKDRQTLPPFNVEPGCPFGAVVRERLTDLQRQVEEVKERLNGLLFLVVGAVVVDIVLRLVR